MKFLNYKLLFWVMVAVAAYLYRQNHVPDKLEDRLVLSNYFFYDSAKKGDDGYVAAEGAWITSTDLAYPLSSVNMECWRQFGHCWIANGTIFDDSVLSVGLDLLEIAEWTDDYVQTKPVTPPSGCVVESYRFDRRTETVTYMRNTLKTDGFCSGISLEPVVSRLGDGTDRLEKSRQKQDR